jgi:RNA polymerase sigma factor (sigma-70 family)
MPAPESTSLTLIARAAAGNREDRETFARVYGPVILSYLRSRWRSSPRSEDLQDAVQEVFVDCFREDGALARLDLDRPQRFRSYLYGVTRNIALRFEASSARHPRAFVSESSILEVSSNEDSGSCTFDRAWAQAVLREALRRHVEEARIKGEHALERVRILDARFERDLPIREIAKLWNTDAARLHKQYARAREEFRGALRATLTDHCGSGGGARRICRSYSRSWARNGPDKTRLSMGETAGRRGIDGMQRP